LDTTQVHAEIDLKMKARGAGGVQHRRYQKPTVGSDGTLMAFLQAI
jgi:hypothetical protein